MHSAPWTNTSHRRLVPAQIAAISSLESSRASTTCVKPISSSSRAPAMLWMLIWVLPSNGRVGYRCRMILASPRSCTSTPSTPAPATASSVFIHSGSSRSVTSVFSVI